MKTFAPRILIVSSLAVAAAQQVGTYSAEEHPPLPIQHCTSLGCATEDTSIVIDHMWRWSHKVDSYDVCMTNYAYSTTNNWTCPDPVTCAQTCALEGVSIADYEAAYGITTAGTELTLRFSEKVPSSRVFLINKDEQYPMFKMLNQEFAFDVDNSDLDCGLNGFIMFVELDADGGMAKYPNNRAGAKYGTGYCDAICTSIKFTDGEANFDNRGHCCSEFDMWEANKMSTQYTPHVLARQGQYACKDDCASVVDYEGCPFNPYLMGNHSFYGPNSTFALDSSKKMTVVTQFVSSDNTANGDLVDVRRLYVQDGKILANSFYGTTSMNSISDPYCEAVVGKNTNHFNNGALKGMGQAFGRGMGLVFGMWVDWTGRMQWLDAGDAGSCPLDAGDPEVLMKQGASIKFNNIRYGDIGTTYAVPLYGRCGGSGYDGPTACKEGTCTKMNDYYSQCVV